MHALVRTAAILTAVAAFTSAMMFATTTVVVEQGDTLSGLAHEHSITLSDLIEWNELNDPDLIFEGQVLHLEAPDGTAVVAADNHAVTAGETLWLIAKRYGSTVAALADANGLTDPDHIIVGQQLRIAGPTPTPTTTTSSSVTTTAPAAPAGAITHTVVSGDTLFSIARTYGVGVHELAELNDLSNPDLLAVSHRLTIPSAGATPTPTTVAPSATSPSTMTAPITTAPATTTTTSAPAGSDSTTSSSATPLANAFDRWSSSYGIPQDLLEALTWKESNWQPAVTGPGGHLGIGQLSPDTVAFVEERLLGLELDPLSMSDGIQLAARYLRYLLDRTDSEREALAAWNQGLWGLQNNGMSKSAAAFADSVLEIRRLRS